MKILFVLRHVAYFRFFDRVVRELCANGHRVELLLEIRHAEREADAPYKDSPRALLACLAEVDGLSWGWAALRSDFWRKPAVAIRELINYSSYLQPGRQASQTIIGQNLANLPGLLQRLVRYRAARALLAVPLIQRALRWFERLIPPDRSIVQSLRDSRPDVVIASPVLSRHSHEMEYIKAAASLNLPTIVAVASWDHLTTRGVFHVIPDLTLVWNQIQVEEAVRWHGLPREKVVATGGPVFDAWFDIRPALGRAAFCRQVGLNPDQPFVLYLCSARSIVQDETGYVEELARILREHPSTCQVNVLVRPYPWHAGIWQNYAGDLLTIWPRGGNNPDTPEARQDYYHAMHFSAAVIGINTSGFIDAAAVDKPCITVLNEQHSDTQRDIAHFQYLLNADFMEVVANPPEAAQTIAAVLAGRDAKRENRRRFVHDFVRPWGLERPAGRMMAAAIQAAGQRHNIEQLRTILAEAGDGPGALAPGPAIAIRA
jgi:hypothetical protein